MFKYSNPCLSGLGIHTHGCGMVGVLTPLFSIVICFLQTNWRPFLGNSSLATNTWAHREDLTLSNVFATNAPYVPTRIPWWFVQVLSKFASVIGTRSSHTWGFLELWPSLGFPYLHRIFSFHPLSFLWTRSLICAKASLLDLPIQ